MTCSKNSTLLHIVLLFGLCLGLWGCGDLVQEDVATSGCNSALNDRKYDTALSKCTARKDRAAAFMGKAGYDIINLLNASSDSAEAITDSAITAVLGTENVGFAFSVNALQLGPNKIPDVTARETAMKEAKTTLENVIDLYDGVSPTGEELVLKTFGTMFAVSLELVLLLDVGLATTLDITNANFTTNLTASGGKHLITSDASIPTSSIATSTIADSTNTTQVEVGNYIEKLDGRIWTTEQNLALLIESIELGPITQFTLGTSASTLELFGNLPAVCRSFSGNKTSTDPPGRGVLELITKLTEVATDFASAFSGSDSDATSEVSDLDATVKDFQTAIDDACDLQDAFSSLP